MNLQSDMQSDLAGSLAGFRFYPGHFERDGQVELRAVLQTAPLFTPRMPKSGPPFNVHMSNCGPLGWVIGIRRAGDLDFARRFVFVSPRRTRAQRADAIHPAKFRGRSRPRRHVPACLSGCRSDLYRHIRLAPERRTDQSNPAPGHTQRSPSRGRSGCHPSAHDQRTRDDAHSLLLRPSVGRFCNVGAGVSGGAGAG